MSQLSSAREDCDSELNFEQGKVIGNYILGKTIGKGTFGKVKVGTHIQSGEMVALKILNKTKFEDDMDHKLVEKEIMILKSIRHKNIIQLYEIIEEGDLIYFIMEFAEGGDFFDHISKNTKLTEKQACISFHQLISAVEYFHSLNIVHRDLKPENILLDFKNNIKISDFGLSSIYTNDKLLTTPCGTPSYAPPEMLKGEEYHGLFSDIWSCGVILYAMLCGYLPFGESNEDLLSKHIITGDFEIPDYLSIHAIDLLHNMLNINPLERFDIEQIKSHPWFRFVNYVFIPGIYLNSIIIPIDEVILDLIDPDNEEERNKIIEAVKQNEFNCYSTSYYLMVKKFVKESGTSISDLCSQEYIQYINNPNNIIREKLEDDDHIEDKTEEIINEIQYPKCPNDQKQEKKAEETRRKSILEILNIETEMETAIPKLEDLESKEEDNNKFNLQSRRLTILKRTDGGRRSTLFEDILKMQVLKELENKGSNMMIEDVMRRKSILENYRRNTIIIDYKKIDLNDNIPLNEKSAEESSSSSDSRSNSNSKSTESKIKKSDSQVIPQFKANKIEEVILVKMESKDDIVEKPELQPNSNPHEKNLLDRNKKKIEKYDSFVDVDIIPVPKNKVKIVKCSTVSHKKLAVNFQKIKQTKYDQVVDPNNPPIVTKVNRNIKKKIISSNSIAEKYRIKEMSKDKLNLKFGHQKNNFRKSVSLMHIDDIKEIKIDNKTKTTNFYSNKNNLLNLKNASLKKNFNSSTAKNNRDIMEQIKNFSILDNQFENNKLLNSNPKQHLNKSLDPIIEITQFNFDETQNNNHNTHFNYLGHDKVVKSNFNTKNKKIEKEVKKCRNNSINYENFNTDPNNNSNSFKTNNSHKKPFTKYKLGHENKTKESKFKFNSNHEQNSIVPYSTLITSPDTNTKTEEIKLNHKISIYSKHKINLDKIDQNYLKLLNNKEKFMDEISNTLEFRKYLDTKNASKLQKLKNLSNLEEPLHNSCHIDEYVNRIETISENKERTTHYHGPVDLSCCLPLKPFLLSCKLINSFKKMRINFIKNDSLNFRCHKEGLHFKMKIFTMIEGELSYLKISQIQGTKSEYNKILIKIFSHFKN